MASDVKVRPSASGRTGVASPQLQDPEPFLKEYANKIQGYREKASTMKIANDHDAERCGVIAGTIAREIESLERQRKEFVDPLNTHVSFMNARFRQVTQPLSEILKPMKELIGVYWQQKALAEKQRVKIETERLAALHQQEVEKARKETERLTKLHEEKMEKARKEAARLEKLHEEEVEKARKETERLTKLHERKVERAEEKGKEAPPPPVLPVVAAAPVLPVIVEAPVLPIVAAAPAAPIAQQVSKSIGKNVKVREIWDFKLAVENDVSLVPFEYLEVNSARVRRAIADGKREISGLKIFLKPSVAV